jgi:hypothetical protein
VVSAVMMALRFEVQQRIKKKPTHEIEEALRLFQQMQVGSAPDEHFISSSIAPQETVPTPD